MIWGQGMIWMKEVVKPTNFQTHQFCLGSALGTPTTIYHLCLTCLQEHAWSRFRKNAKITFENYFQRIEMATNDCTKL